MWIHLLVQENSTRSPAVVHWVRHNLSQEAEKWSEILPSGYVKIAIEAMAIEIVDFPIKKCDFP